MAWEIMDRPEPDEALVLQQVRGLIIDQERLPQCAERATENRRNQWTAIVILPPILPLIDY